MFTKAFWIATTERAVAQASGGVLTIAGVDGVLPSVDITGLKAYGLMFVGGLCFSVLKALAAYNLTSSGGPSLTPKAEVDAALAPLVGTP